MYNIVHSSTEEADWGLRSLKRKPNWIFCQTAAPAATLFDLIKTSGKFFANHQESLVDLYLISWSALPLIFSTVRSIDFDFRFFHLFRSRFRHLDTDDTTRILRHRPHHGLHRAYGDPGRRCPAQGADDEGLPVEDEHQTRATLF